jgi:hypothetical protein
LHPPPEESEFSQSAIIGWSQVLVNQPIRIMDNNQKVQAIAPLHSSWVLSSLEISITKQFNIFAAMRW